MNWLLVVIVFLVLVFILKLAHFKTKIILTALIIFFLLFYFSFSLVAKENDLNFNTVSGVIQASKIYFSWLGQTFNNIKVITANAIGLDWIPENKTLEDMSPKNVMRG